MAPPTAPSDTTDDTEGQHLVIVSGLSGSGKSVALAALEDLEFFCVDNLPAALLPAFAATVLEHPQRYPRVAVGIDARNRDAELSEIPAQLDALSATGMDCQLWFLTADERILIQRFSETRRRHPLTADDATLPAAIQQESALLAGLQQHADWVFDTSDTNVHQLRHQVWKWVSRGSEPLLLILESFAFKQGVPQDADFIFDVRCLPNPYWQPALRGYTGQQPEIAEWLEGHEPVRRYRQDILDFLARWLPAFRDNQRSYVTVAIGCTGGKHRSVYLAEELARRLRQEHGEVVIHHRELDNR